MEQENSVQVEDSLKLSDSVQVELSPHGAFSKAELVFALVCPLGTDHNSVIQSIGTKLQQFGYQMNHIRLSGQFKEIARRINLTADFPDDPAQAAIRKIELGNEMRKQTGSNEILAIAASALIASLRLNSLTNPPIEEPMPAEPKPLSKPTAHVITTLKRPEEVDTLRRIYGTGFFLIGLSSSRAERERYLSQRGISEEANNLINRDQDEKLHHGQKTRETFQLADVFISMDNFVPQISRFLDLLFGCPSHTPTAQEHAMFMAYAASLRSGDLSRQVGAAIVDASGDLLSVGYNEVPKFGGGLYGPEPGSHRDIESQSDSNDLAKKVMIQRLMTELEIKDKTVDQVRQSLRPTGLMDLTEFGRSVHAEMEALLACARTSRSPRGATLYTTTFPCHNCCRHVIAAGISKVVYIEPYPKSRASDLHGDAVSIDMEEAGKLCFTPFIGVGPRRYFDLFSLKLSTGMSIERKENGMLIPWIPQTAQPRIQMPPNSYLERESIAWKDFEDILAKGQSHG